MIGEGGTNVIKESLKAENFIWLVAEEKGEGKILEIQSMKKTLCALAVLKVEGAA